MSVGLVIGSGLSFVGDSYVGANDSGASVAVLLWSQQPTAALSGVVISPAITVTKTLADGVTTDTSYTGAVTIGKQSGSGALGGTLTRNAVAGVATFNDLTCTGADTYQLNATASGLSQINSTTFAITVPSLAMTTQPSNVNALDVMSPSPVVTASDATFTGLVTVTIASGTGAIQSGGTVTAVAGVATFSALKLRGVGTLTLTFTASGFTSVTSIGFTVAPMVARPTTIQVNTFNAPYQMFVPVGVMPAAGWPVLIGWHGSTTSGTNNTAQLGDGIAPTCIANESTWPYLTFFPQYHTAGDGNGNAIVDQLPPLLVAQLAAEGLSYDRRRVYLFGHSLGGTFVMDELYLFPTLFAAAIVTSANANPARLNPIVPGGLPGYTHNVDPTLDFQLAANAVRAAIGNLPMRQYQGSLDAAITGFSEPVATYAEAGAIDNTQFSATDINYSFIADPGGATDHSGTNTQACLLFATPASSGQIWLSAQQQSGSTSAAGSLTFDTSYMQRQMTRHRRTA